MGAIQFKGLGSAKHLRCFVTGDGGEQVQLEVYTGLIHVQVTGAGDHVHREKITSFIPINATHINTYVSGPIDVTVTCVPSSVADEDDEANVAAVDWCRVDWGPQNVSHVGDVDCLTLVALVAAHKATVISVAYQVTVLMPAPREGDFPAAQPSVEVDDVDDAPTPVA